MLCFIIKCLQPAVGAVDELHLAEQQTSFLSLQEVVHHLILLFISSVYSLSYFRCFSIKQLHIKNLPIFHTLFLCYRINSFSNRFENQNHNTIKYTHINKYPDMDQPIISEDNPRPFIVRVKLLTNEVFEFEVDKNIKVAQFKTMISPKVNVPVDKMRIVFAGKQLVDDKPLCDYVTESGLTVHLIARTAPANDQASSQPAQNPPNQQPSSGNVPPPQLNPFGDIMGMVNSMFGGQIGGQQPGAINQPPQIAMTFGNVNGPLNNQLGGLLGSLGIRIPQTQPPQPQQQTNIQPQPSQQTGSQSQQRPPRISYSQIGQLNNNLNTLNIPLDNVTTEQQTLTPEGVIRYLRRVHHQSTRSMMQLNRLLNSAENGNTSNLQNFIPIFQSLNSVNNVAINCLNHLQSQRHSNQPQNNTNNATNSTNQQSNRQPVQPSQSNPQQNPVVNMEIVVSQMVSDGNQQPNNQQQAQQAFNPMAMLGGLNLGSLLGGLDSVGGVNGLFGMSLRDMMSENGQSQVNGIMIDLFGGMTGQHIMQAFTTKNFAFLKDNRNQIRENLKKKISESNQESVIERITAQASMVLIPTRDHPMISNGSQCQQKCKKNLKKYVKKLVAITLSQNQPDYDLKVVQIGKLAFCQNVNIISQYTTNKSSNVAFQVIKAQAISTLQPVLPGLSGLLYNLIERDLLRIYNEYKAEQERKSQMSHEETESEQRLIELIKQAGSRDSEKLANMPHSEYYYRQQE